MGKDFFF